LAIRSQPKFQRANSSIVPIGSGYEVFRSHIVLGKLELESAVVALVEEIERARQLGFTKSELELSKKAYLSLMQQKYSERDKTISSVFSQKYILHFLMHDAIPSIENELSYVSEFLPTITIDEINQAAQKIIPHMEQKLVVYAGNEDPYLFLPNPQYLVTVAEKGEQFNFLLNKDIFTTKEKNITNQIKIVNPNQGQIISDIENLKLGIHELILSNGIKVILKSTDFQNDQILMRASRFGGQSLYDEQDTYNARYANTIVSQLGWKGLSAGHINETFAGHVFSVSSNLDLYTEGISASTRGEDMEQMFQVVNLHFALPSIDKPIFNGLITNWQVAAKSNLANPIDVYRNTVLTETYQHHSRALHFPKPEDFAKVDIWRATEIFHERFGSAKDFVFTIVGNFSIEKIKPFIATYIASLPTTDVVTNYRDLGIRPATGIIKKEILKGLDPVSNVFIGFSGDSIYSNIDNIQFLALLDVFELIINQALREKLGLIYTYGVRGELSRVPNSNFKIGMAIPCKPENVDRVIQEIFSEIKKIQGNGPEQTDLEKVRENWRKQHQIDVRTNQYWLDNLQDAALYRTDPEEILEAEKRIQALDQAGIQAAAKKYFNTQNYVQVVLYPEKN
jgi:zinc protease